jgi:hypothetical protein
MEPCDRHGWYLDMIAAAARLCMDEEEDFGPASRSSVDRARWALAGEAGIMETIQRVVADPVVLGPAR